MNKKVYIVEGQIYERLIDICRHLGVTMYTLEDQLQEYEANGYPVTWVVLEGPATANYDLVCHIAKWTGDWKAFYDTQDKCAPRCPSKKEWGDE
jgi:hypothetical protein